MVLYDESLTRVLTRLPGAGGAVVAWHGMTYRRAGVHVQDGLEEAVYVATGVPSRRRRRRRPAPAPGSAPPPIPISPPPARRPTLLGEGAILLSDPKGAN